MFLAYLRTFKRMGLTAIPMQAETGPIGGNMSHEFQILAQTGESAVYYDAAFEQIDFNDPDLEPETLKALYAAADEKHDPAACPLPADRLRSGRGIEVGHIFHFGTKYSQADGCHGDGPRRQRGAGRDGLLRHRRVAAGGCPDRGVPRREGHRLARERGAVPDRPGQPAPRRRPRPRAWPRISTAACTRWASTC